jgi:hypothetical protein
VSDSSRRTTWRKKRRSELVSLFFFTPQSSRRLKAWILACRRSRDVPALHGPSHLCPRNLCVIHPGDFQNGSRLLKPSSLSLSLFPLSPFSFWCVTSTKSAYRTNNLFPRSLFPYPHLRKESFHPRNNPSVKDSGCIQSVPPRRS